MNELLDAWINCKENEEEFVARTRVFVLDSAEDRHAKGASPVCDLLAGEVQ